MTRAPCTPADGRSWAGADQKGYTHVVALDRNRLIAHRRLTPRLTIDDHNNPSLYVRTDGRIMVFYSADNGPEMVDPVSTKPYSIARSRRRTDRNEHAGGWCYTYPSPLRADGRLWLLFRGANWQPSYTTAGALVARREPRSRAALARASRPRAPRPGRV